MTSSHILFIPGVLLVGLFLGFILGGRAVKNQLALQERREEERAAARAARAAKKAAGDEKKSNEKKSDDKSSAPT